MCGCAWTPSDRRRLIIAEEKTRGGQMSIWYARFIKEILDPALRLHCELNGIKYGGFLLIQFENTSPNDGKIFIDSKQVSAEELKQLLSA